MANLETITKIIELGSVFVAGAGFYGICSIPAAAYLHKDTDGFSNARSAIKFYLFAFSKVNVKDFFKLSDEEIYRKYPEVDECYQKLKKK